MNPLRTALWAVIAGLSLLLASAIWARADWSKVAGEWDQYQLNDSERAWFKSIKAPNGVPCCDISDGHPTKWERRQDGTYIPDPIHLEEPRQWIKVPDEAIIKGAKNPIGVATVWWVVQYSGGRSNRSSEAGFYIRCFVSDSEG